VLSYSSSRRFKISRFIAQICSITSLNW
jgi:hypothetical protein